MEEIVGVWSGGNRVARGKEKTSLVLSWLADFHHSTPSVLSKRLGVDVNGQRAFFSRLISSDVLQVVSVPTIRERLLMLTPNGRELARAITEKAVNYRTEPSKITASNIRHSLSTQIAVTNRLSNACDFSSERHLKFTDRKRLPDAIIVSDMGRLAIEAELVHKNDARIYRAFYDHLGAIKKKYYTSVEYVFPSDTLRDYYYRRFVEPLWPVFEFNGAGRLIKTPLDFDTRQRDLQEALPKMFKFTSEELYQ